MSENRKDLDIQPTEDREYSSGADESRADHTVDDAGGTTDRLKKQSRRPGSRDVTGGTTSGTDVGGTRNFRTGSGAAGSDIGNRPE